MACYPSFTDPDKSEVWLNKTMQEVLKYMVQHGFRTAVFTDRINRQPYDGRNLGEYYSSGVQTAGFMKYLLDNFPHMCIESPVVQNFNYNSMTNASLIQAISFTPSAKLLKKSRAILPDNHRTADVFLERLAGHYRASLKATAKAVKLRYL